MTLPVLTTKTDHADLIMAADINDIHTLIPKHICKSVIETINNSTVFQNDDDFTFSMGASEVWMLKFYMLVTAANTTADIKFQLSVPAAATYSIGTFGDPTAVAAFGGVVTTGTPLAVSTTEVKLATNNATIGVRLTAIVANSTTSGTCVLQWAQNTLSATNLSIQPNSIMEYVRVK
jgi:hypothetical protein